MRAWIGHTLGVSSEKSRIRLSIYWIVLQKRFQYAFRTFLPNRSRVRRPQGP